MAADAGSSNRLRERAGPTVLFPHGMTAYRWIGLVAPLESYRGLLSRFHIHP